MLQEENIWFQKYINEPHDFLPTVIINLDNKKLVELYLKERSSYVIGDDKGALWKALTSHMTLSYLFELFSPYSIKLNLRQHPYIGWHVYTFIGAINNNT